MTEHEDIPIGEIHISQNLSYANAAARTSASGLLPADIGTIARQTDTEEWWVLIDDSPVTWKLLTGGAPLAATGEIFLSSAGGWPSTTNGCADNVKKEYATNDIDLFVLDFDKDNDEFAQWSVPMPADWDGGTVTALFIWTAAAGSISDDVVWGLQGRSYVNDEAIDKTWGTAQVIVDTLLALDVISYTDVTPAITLAGTPAAGEWVQFRGYRDADAVADDLAADAGLLGIMVTYTRT